MKKHNARRRRIRAARGAGSLQSAKKATYILRLYITGSTPRAKAAVMKIKSFCEEHLNGQYELDIIDIYQQPGFAREEQIIAAPTLVKKLPQPEKKLVGDFSSVDRVKLGLDMQIGAEKPDV